MNKQNGSKLKRQRKTNLYFIMKVIQLSKLQVFNRRHSLNNFPRRWKTFDNTAFRQLSIVFPRQTPGMFSRGKCLSLCKIFGGLFFIKDCWIFFLFSMRVLKIFAGKNDWMTTRACESRHSCVCPLTGICQSQRVQYLSYCIIN